MQHERHDSETGCALMLLLGSLAVVFLLATLFAVAFGG